MISTSGDSTDEIAERFVSARQQHRALAEFPGKLPATLDVAYRIQDKAIARWSGQIGGWKVGLIGSQFRMQHGADRLVGPIFNSSLQFNVSGKQNPLPIFVDGFGAVEAEFVFRIATDTPQNKTGWTDEEAIQVVEGLYAGVEIASSPLAIINDLGPTSIVSDFGNNNGLIVGARIDHWQQRLNSPLRCSTRIDNAEVGTGNAASIPGGPIASLVFALSICAGRGFPLRAGQFICTGAVTGVHKIQVPQRAVVQFDQIDTFECEAVASNTSTA